MHNEVEFLLPSIHEFHHFPTTELLDIWVWMNAAELDELKELAVDGGVMLPDGVVRVLEPIVLVSANEDPENQREDDSLLER